MDFYLSVSSIIILCFFLTILPPSYCDEDDRFAVCNRTYTCGSVNISYPFWGAGGRPEYCGRQIQGYKLSCINEYLVITIEEQEFPVININTSSRSFTIARPDLWYGPCSPNLLNTTLDYNLFDYTSNVENVTILYGCPPQDLENNSIPIPNRFNCSQLGVPTEGKMNAYIVDQYQYSSNQLLQLTNECDYSIKVPILNSSAIALHEDPQGGAAAVGKAMNQGIEVEYSIELAAPCRPCEASGGVCGSNSTQTFLCFCRDEVQSLTTCPPKPVAGMHACSLFSSHILGLGFFALIILFLLLAIGHIVV